MPSVLAVLETNLKFIVICCLDAITSNSGWRKTAALLDCGKQRLR